MINLILFTLSISIQPTYSTNTTYIYEVTGRDSVIYCATNGGFLAFNTLSNDYAVVILLSAQAKLGFVPFGH